MSDNSALRTPQSKIALVFPGQGSQAIGMGKDLFNNFAAAREVFQEADEALGFSLSSLCFEGDEAELQLTANTQPAILATSVAAYRVALGEGLNDPDFVAGHSLGEYSALVAADAITFSDAIKTVRNRGTYMQEAVPFGVGAMAAILGLPLAEVEAGCAEAAEDGVCSPANINSGSQIVIAGSTEAVDRAIENLKARGAKRAIKLNVSAPFHCALMMPAQERLKVDLKQLSYGEISFPVVHNVDAVANSDSGAVCDKLTRQVSSPVRWLQSVEAMISSGVAHFVELGEGKVLSGLIKQINRDVQCVNISNSETLKNYFSNGE